MTRPALSERQADALAAIKSHIDDHGCPPTVRELANEMGIVSTNGATDHITALERKGYITRVPMLSRNIRLVTDCEHEPPTDMATAAAMARTVLERGAAAPGAARALAQEVLRLAGATTPQDGETT